MEHTEQCWQEQKKWKARHDGWVAQWPNYCRDCNGAGEHHWTENGAPWGAGYWPMPMADVCESCVTFGKCPRCGTADMLDPETGEGPCKACGWNYDDECPLEFFDGPCSCVWEFADTKASWSE